MSLLLVKKRIVQWRESMDYVVVSVEGIEPPSHAPKARILPLNYTENILGALGVNRTPDLGLQNRCFTTRTNRAKFFGSTARART